MPQAPSTVSAGPVPGIYVLSRPARERLARFCDRSVLGLSDIGGFAAAAIGPLASTATDGDAHILFEGILTGGRHPERSDAEVALAAYRRGGIPALAALPGYYQLALIEAPADRAVIVSDPLATRPLYLYRGAKLACATPDPLFFSRCRFPMTVDRVGLYEMLRVCHPIGKRSLVRELSRSRPRVTYALSAGGRLEETAAPPLCKTPDRAMDIDTAARQIRDITAEVIAGILDHPRLAGLPVELPLTAGMDSRHILGELLAQRRPPARVRHVRIHEREAGPAIAMAEAFDIPVCAPALAEVDLTALTRRWIARTAGLVHYHQLYLMAVGQDVPATGVVGFDGYLMGYYFGFYQAAAPMAQRRYTRALMPVLFADHAALDKTVGDDIAEEQARFVGPERFCNGGVDSFNRGPHYTGGMFPILADSAYYFAPGAHEKALAFFCTAPEEAAGQKRARLHMFRHHFPKLAQFPTVNGKALVGLSSLRRPRDVTAERVRAFCHGMATLHRTDPAPDSEHAWLRQIPFLRRVCDRLSRESALGRDGQVRRHALPWMWRLHRAGGFVAFPLMGMVSCEVAYRVLAKGEAPESVADWLTSGD